MNNRITQSAFEILIALLILVSACRPAEMEVQQSGPSLPLSVIATESLLKDITQNVAGDRAIVETLIPPGVDPHSFEPVPGDLKRLTDSRVIVVNGAGLESGLQDFLENAEQIGQIIVASKGLEPRRSTSPDSEHAGEVDPHFWFDPILTIRYVENIRDGLISIDPDGREQYSRNAADYTEKLKELDAWIAEQTSLIPPEQRLMVTNHESFGYFADRYGFTIVGAVLPGVSPGVSPSAGQLADLIAKINQSRAQAIFLETGSNPDLAEQIAAETGVQVVSDLYTHSLSHPDSPAATYLDLMRHNVSVIVESLK